MASDKFVQPDVVVVKRAETPGTFLPESILEIGRSRIAQGEDPDSVAHDLALLELNMLGLFRTPAEQRVLAKKETPLHAAADAHVPKLKIAFRYAFAQGRKALGATPNAERAAAAVKRALMKTLVPMLTAAVVDGGTVAAKQLRKLRAAGGPGSGNFGHAGRPGEIGGSSASALSDSLRNPADMSFEEFSNLPTLPEVAEGHVRLIHVTEAPNVESILREGLRVDKARGATYGEPSVVWATTENEQWGGSLTPHSRAVIFDLPVGEVSQAGTLARMRDVPPERIVTVERAGYSGVSTGALTLRQERSTSDEDERRLYWEAYRKERRNLAGPIRFTFNAKDKAAIAWAEEHAAELVTQISNTTRDYIAQAIAATLEGELSIEEARDTIEAAVGDDERAELIARHETMVAASEGQRQAWDQAVDSGLLTGNEKRTWIVTPDDKLCPVCEDLDGSVADLDGEYPGGFDGPPAHVACRCTEGLA